MIDRHMMVMRMMRQEREGSPPTIHPNGFIQLKLTNGRRMHFWHPDIPRQKVGSPIHDHVFDMRSSIMLGSLFHREVKILPNVDGYYEIWQAKPIRDTETVLVGTGQRVKANHCTEQELGPGESYEFPAFTFHLTRDPVPAVSMISKLQNYPGKPRVLVPAGEKPDNDFTRDSFPNEFIEMFMLSIIEEAK
jgi:hypothetical protein